MIVTALTNVCLEFHMHDIIRSGTKSLSFMTPGTDRGINDEGSDYSGTGN